MSHNLGLTNAYNPFAKEVEDASLTKQDNNVQLVCLDNIAVFG